MTLSAMGHPAFNLLGHDRSGSRPAEWCNSVCLGMMSQGAERPEASSPGAPEIGVVIVDLR